jgi:hypothetical protein
MDLGDGKDIPKKTGGAGLEILSGIHTQIPPASDDGGEHLDSDRFGRLPEAYGAYGLLKEDCVWCLICPWGDPP